MDIFVPYYGNARLFIATRSANEPQPPGELLFVLPQPTAEQAISLSQAWTSETLLGSFVYSAAGLGVTAETADLFVDAVQAKVHSAGVRRAFLWVSNGIDNAGLLGLTPSGNGTLTPLNVPVATGLSFVIDTPASLVLTGSTVQIGSASLGYTGQHAPQGAAVTSASLDLDGPLVAAISYSAAFTGTSLLTASSWGFQFAHPGEDGPTRLWLPLAAAPEGTVSFAVTIDPSDPLNAVAPPIRSRMNFTGPAGPTTLTSSLLTRQGKPIRLMPKLTGPSQQAGLVFDLGIGDRPVLLAPVGDFDLGADTGPDLAYLMCGLNGTEAITFLRQGGPDGEVLRFTPYRAAYAPRYPFAAASPVSPQTDPTAPLLDSTYTTSWTSIGTGKPMYVAQPQGAPLYRWTADYSTSNLLAWADQAQGLPLDVPFPLAGYGLPPGGWTSPTIADFEHQVIAPVRRQLIGQHTQARVQDDAQAEPYTTTTPTGQIVTIADGTWTSILLGKTPNPAKPGGTPPALPELALCFSKPKPELQEALQTGSLFLVVANGYYLGDQHEGDGKPQPVPTFNNAVNIGGWRLEAKVGSGNAYGDYRNVMIVKGRRGKLYDRAKPTDSLIANPEKWTQQDFAIPSEPVDGSFSSRQRRELVVLSQWLQDYFAAAPASDPDYAKFNAIAADPNWTGTLFLRVDITDVPADLVGITAGIDDPAGFSAHHLGIEATAVKVSGKDPGNLGDSSMFGLIGYTDPKFTVPKRGPARPIRPAPATTYDFKLLTLGVSFANTAVRRFASLAQLTATTWFDMPVDHMGDTGNRFSALLLTGTLQTNDGLPVYSLASTEDALFYLGNDIVRKVEITSAVMSTQSAGDSDTGDAKDAAAASWFSLSGFLDFEVVRGADPGDPGEPLALDLFSFGSPAGEDQPRSGLAFSNLGILMSFPPDSPADRVFTFDAGRIQFDVATSTPREGSLFRQFALEVAGIVSGGVLTPPRRSGYLQVVTDARLTGVERGPWWGIEYVLTMGSAGHLAGQAGLNGHLLTAWSPRKARGRAANRQDADTYQAGIGLKLPGTGGGAKLISLQSVLRLSIGQLWLRYDTEAGAFLLLLSEIALRVLGLGKLPPGSTLFYLYGDPNQAGSSSGLGWYAMYQRSQTAQREVAGK